MGEAGRISPRANFVIRHPGLAAGQERDPAEGLFLLGYLGPGHLLLKFRDDEPGSSGCWIDWGLCTHFVGCVDAQRADTHRRWERYTQATLQLTNHR